MKGVRQRPIKRDLSSVVVTVSDPTTIESTLRGVSELVWPTSNREVLVAVPPGASLGEVGDLIGTRVVEYAGVGAAAWNEGMQRARGERVAFLEAGVHPEPGWLRDGLAAFRSHVDLGAAASWVLDDRGETEFAGATMSEAGEMVVDSTEPSETRSARLSDSLFCSPAAFILDSQAWCRIGGFDETLSPEVAAADLAWRLWLAGYRVMVEPESRVSRMVPKPLTDPIEHRYSMLRMLDQNLGDEARSALVSAALIAAEREGLAAAVERFRRGRSTSSRTRAGIQRARRVPDVSILTRFDRDTSMQSARVAIVTPDVIQPKMAGPAIRAWHMAMELAKTHEVCLATTVHCTLEHADFDVRRVNDAELRELEAWCDILVFQGNVMWEHPWLRRSAKIVVVDLYDPLHLEVLEQARDQGNRARMESARHTIDLFNEQIGRGDFFLCASAKQRDLWLGHLGAVGRINPATYDDSENLERLLAIAPFGLSDESPEHSRAVLRGVVPGIGADDTILLWGGGIYNWFDPLTLVRAVDKLRHRVPEVRLFFLGLQHPNPDVPEMRMAYEAQRLSNELGLTNTHVFFNQDWVAYEDRQNYLLEADIGVSTHLDHVETAFSFRTRLLDCLWASLPMVVTQGDSFAELIEQRGLGAAVPAGDVDALEAALFDLIDDAERRRTISEAVAKVAPEFLWSVVLAPLIEFCRHPQRAPDLVHPQQHQFVDPDELVLGRSRMRRYLRTAGTALGHLRDGELDEIGQKVRRRIRLRADQREDGPAPS